MNRRTIRLTLSLRGQVWVCCHHIVAVISPDPDADPPCSYVCTTGDHHGFVVRESPEDILALMDAVVPQTDPAVRDEVDADRFRDAIDNAQGRHVPVFYRSPLVMLHKKGDEGQR